MSHHAHKLDAFSLEIEDRVGALLKVAEDLVGHGISLKALWAWTEDEGMAKVVFVPEDPSLVASCGCETCCAAKVFSVLWVDAADRVGALRDNLAKMAEAGINIQAVHALGLSGQAAAIFTFADEATLDAALAALAERCAP